MGAPYYGSIPLVESLATYYRRSAERERQLASHALDPDLRRIHTRNAENFERRAKGSFLLGRRSA
jgi:hypothetical protein